MPLFPFLGALLPQNHPLCLGAPRAEQSPAPGTVCADDLGTEMTTAPLPSQQPPTTVLSVPQAVEQQTNASVLNHF